MAACVCVKQKWDEILRNNTMYISISLQCSILVLHFEEFQFQKEFVILHIPSKYSKEMAQSSQTVSLVYRYINKISQHFMFIATPYSRFHLVFYLIMRTS